MSREPTPADLVAWLSTPAAYGGAGTSVERIETHFAWVFLVGERAYKLKKRIRVYGADLRLAGERERCCHEEVRLNSRLASGTYLGVVPVVARGDAPALGGDGEAVDWLVAMRRLDHERMLDTALRARRVGPEDLVPVVARLCELGTAPTAPPVVARLARDHLARRVEEALRECARAEFRVPSTLLGAVDRGLRAAAAACERELFRRSARARDGHGDLRCEHVHLGPPVQIIDALEFDAALRLLEPAEELAMLAVDAERIAGAWVGDALREAYASVAEDPVPPAVWRFQLALRAATRAKVALWHLDDPELREAGARERWLRRGHEYLEAAAQHLAR